MSTYGTLAGITPRVGGRVISSGTVPSSTDVQGWLDQAEAQLKGLLLSVDIPWVYSASTVGALTIQGWVETYVAGQVRRSWAAMAGANGADGLFEVQGWSALLAEIKREPQLYGALLSGAGTDQSATILASNVSDGVAVIGSGQDLDDGPYAPIFRLDRSKPDSQL